MKVPGGALWLIWAAIVAHGAAILLPCSDGVCSLANVQAAINAAAPGDTIFLGNGTYTGCPMIASEVPTRTSASLNITIVGTGAGVTVDCFIGGSYYLAARFSDVITVRNIVFTRGTSQNPGDDYNGRCVQYENCGAIQVWNNASLSLVGVTISATGDRTILAWAGSLFMQSVLVTGNINSVCACGNYGVVQFGGTALVSIVDSVFTGNTANGYGGAICAGIRLTVITPGNCDNQKLSPSSSDVTIRNSSFTNNLSLNGGGHIYVHQHAEMKVYTSSFSSGTAKGSGGGAILLQQTAHNTLGIGVGARLEVYTSRFVSNFANIGFYADSGGCGGAIRIFEPGDVHQWADEHLIIIQDSWFESNSAYCLGSAISGFAFFSSQLSGLTFVNNIGPPALAVEAFHTQTYGCNIQLDVPLVNDNFGLKTNFSISNSTFINNPGAMIISFPAGHPASPINIKNSTFLNNDAGRATLGSGANYNLGDGGAINIVTLTGFTKPGVFVISNCFFQGNQAKAGSNGGAIAQMSITSTMSIVNCTFLQNTAFQGGAIFANNPITAFGQNVLSGNFAACSAPAVYATQSLNDVGSTFMNHTASAPLKTINVLDCFGCYYLSFTNTTFVRNFATLGSVVSSVSTTTAIFTGCFISQNSATSLFAVSGDANVTITGMSAIGDTFDQFLQQSGGVPTTLKVTDSLFSNLTLQTANNLLSTIGNLFVSTSTFANIRAQQSSFLIAGSSGPVVVDSCIFTGNVFPTLGLPSLQGFILVDGVTTLSTLTLRASLFSGNSGGGVVLQGIVGARFNIANTQFDANVAIMNNFAYVSGVNIQGGTITGSTFTNSQSVGGVVVSSGPLSINTTTFSGNTVSLGPVVALSAASALTQLTFTNNKATSGLITVKSASLTLTNATIQSNSVATSGTSSTPAPVAATGSVVVINNTLFDGNIGLVGGVSLVTSSATLVGVTFNNNQQTSVDADTNSPLSVVSSMFTGNSGINGGAINARGNATISSSTFSNNRANLNGGAISAQSPTGSNILRMTDVVLGKNFAGSSGGGVYFTSRATLVRVSAQQNFAPKGGVLNMANPVSGTASLSVSSSSFTSNNGSGGVLYVASGGTIGIASSIMTGNTAPNLAGGALLIVAASALAVSDTVVSNNRADLAGGAFRLTTVPATLNNVSFTANTAAAESGGAIATNAALTCIGCTFSSNSAKLHGGAFNTTAVLSDQNGKYAANLAGTQGVGGAIAASATVTLNGADVMNNKARRGGAVYASGPLNLINTDLTANTATQNGGGIYAAGGAVTIDAASTVTLNTAANLGGGLSCSAGPALVVAQGVIHDNHAADPTAPQADCTACGCCSPPIQSFFPEPTCVLLQSGATSCSNYNCSIGYSPALSSLTCLTSNPCPPIPCDKAQTNAYASSGGVSVTYSNDPSPDPVVTGGYATFTCKFGYQAGANDTVSINCTGPNWDFARLANFGCTPRPCKGLQPPGNSPAKTNVSITDGIAGDYSRLVCPPGYATNPLAIYAGCWIYPVPGWGNFSDICRPGSCDSISKRTDIHYTAPQLKVGETLTLSCDPTSCPPGVPCDADDYILAIPYTPTICCVPGCPPVNGSNNTNCYSPDISAATCIPFPCESFETTPYGQWIFDATNNNGNYTGGTLSLNCSEAYLPEGVTTAVCVKYPTQKGGRWLPYIGDKNTGQLPVTSAAICVPRTCTVTRQDLVAYCDLNTTQASFNGICKVSCAGGYFSQAAANTTITCSVAFADTTEFYPSQESVICTRCSADSWSDVGAPSCTQCVNGYSKGNAAAVTDCYCNPGFYALNAGDPCLTCVTGGYCAGDRAAPVADDGYYPTTVANTFAACNPAKACMRGGICAAGYDGDLCGACIRGYYRLSGECLPCPKDSAVRIGAFIVVGLLASTILISIAQPSPIADRTYGIVSITIAINFIQLVTTFLKTSLKWTFSVRSFMSATSALNLNIELAAPECVIEITYYNKFQAIMIAPLVVAATMLMACGVLILKNWIQLKRPRWAVFKETVFRTAKSCLAGFILFLTLAYLVLAQGALSLFNCQYIPDKDGAYYVLTESPSDKCFSGAVWSRNAVLAIFGIIIYVIGTPLMVLGVYMRQRRKYGIGEAGEDPLVNFFVVKYQTTTWYWESLVMLRKLLVVVISQFFGAFPYIQVILSCMLFFGSLVVALINKPYRWWWHNTADDASLISLIVVLFCGLASTFNVQSFAAAAVTDVVAMFSIVLVLVILLVVLGMELYIFLTVAAISAKQLESSIDFPGAGGVTVAFDPLNSKTVHAAGRDGRVVTLEYSTDAPVTVPRRTFSVVSPLHSMITVPDSNYVVLGAAGTVQVWCTEPPQLACKVDLDASHAQCLAFSSESRLLCIGRADGHLVIYQFERILKRNPTESDAVRSAQAWEEHFHRRGTITAMDSFVSGGLNAPGGGMGTIGEEPETSGGPSSTLDSADDKKPEPVKKDEPAAPSGGAVASLASHDDAELDEEMAMLDAMEGGGIPLTAMTPSSANDGMNDAPSFGGEMHAEPMASGAVGLTHGRTFTDAHGGAVAAAVFATRFLYTCGGISVKRWSAKLDKVLREWLVPFEAHRKDEALTALEVMGSHVFAGSKGSLIYDIDTQSDLIRIISGHTDSIRVLCGDTARLFSAGSDGRLRLWNPSNGMAVQKFPESTQAITSVAANANQLVWTTAAGVVKYFKINTKWNRVDPEILLEPVYAKFPFLRPGFGRRKKGHLATSSDDLGTAEHVSLLMENFSLDQMPEAQVGAVIVALEESISRYDGKARAI